MTPEEIKAMLYKLDLISSELCQLHEESGRIADVLEKAAAKWGIK